MSTILSKWILAIKGDTKKDRHEMYCQLLYMGNQTHFKANEELKSSNSTIITTDVYEQKGSSLHGNWLNICTDSDFLGVKLGIY